MKLLKIRTIRSGADAEDVCQALLICLNLLNPIMFGDPIEDFIFYEMAAISITNSWCVSTVEKRDRKAMCKSLSKRKSS